MEIISQLRVGSTDRGLLGRFAAIQTQPSQGPAGRSSMEICTLQNSLVVRNRENKLEFLPTYSIPFY